jgi:CheY-like chemotaxis protein
MSNYSAAKTILCIDDDDGVLSYHRALLERRGYEVLTATSARLGLQLAEICPVAAVVVDYHMPEMNGHEVATKIKSIRPQVPIVMVSGDDAVPEQALDAVDAFVSKNEVARCLLSVLNRVCREGHSSFPVSDSSVA